jgi:hypothetical protein
VQAVVEEVEVLALGTNGYIKWNRQNTVVMYRIFSLDVRLLAVLPDMVQAGDDAGHGAERRNNRE